MAITKQFFFDGDEIREEKVVRDGKDTQRKREAVGNIVHLRGTGVSERPGFVAGKEKQKDLTDMGEISMLVSSLLSKMENSMQEYLLSVGMMLRTGLYRM